MVSGRGLALHALATLMREPDARLRELLENRGTDRREFAFAFELTHGVLRRLRLLDHVLEGLAHRGLPKDPALRTALRLGAYQLLFVGGMPAHAAVHETVAMVRANKGFANALLRRIAALVHLREADPAKPRDELPLGPTRTLELPRPLPADEAARLAVVHSLPDFLVQRWGERYGLAALRQIAIAASAVPPVHLRTAADVERATLQAELAAAGVDVEPAAHARLLRWRGGESPFGTAPYRVGRFLVQDPTALAAAEALPLRAGDTVIDLCAAPGTKTTLLAERVRPNGRVFAHDVDANRLERVRDNVERLRLQSLVQVVDATAGLPLADAVLADVPCSNTGVLGRRIEVRTRLEHETFTELPSLQRQLLAQAIALTRCGGLVLYSTCSIELEENGDVVAAVLADPATPRCTQLGSELTLPHAGVRDGGYWCLLRRDG